MTEFNHPFEKYGLTRIRHLVQSCISTPSSHTSLQQEHKKDTDHVACLSPFHWHCFSTSKMATERSFIMIKPDAVERGLIAKIIGRFEEKGFQLVAMKFTQVRFIHYFVLNNYYRPSGLGF